MAVRVVVDATGLGDGSAVRGIGSVLRPLIAGLASHPDLALTLLTDPGAPREAGTDHRPLRLRGPGRFQHLEHLVTTGLVARRVHADVAWFPANLPPLLPPRPFVATLHDIIPLQQGHRWSTPDGRRWRLAAHGLRGAAAVLCPSQATADAAVQTLGLQPERTSVVPWGIGEEFTPAGPVDAVGAVQPHLLWVSAFDEHKGLPEACALVAALAARGLPHRLRLVGPFDGWSRPLVEAVVAVSPRPDLIDVVGWADDLPAAYRAASGFVVTSHVEGFGLPSVEAQACGLPVIGFASAAVAEVAGPGAILVPVGDQSALAEAAATVLTDPARHAELRARGLANAARFSWAATIDAYAAALCGAAR
jgi:glycosyltransferase involved in cell wall biosynthesis